jgi:hypothetical protein
MLQTILTAPQPWSHDVLPVPATVSTIGCMHDYNRLIPSAAACNTVSLNEKTTKTAKYSEFFIWLPSRAYYTKVFTTEQGAGRND